MFSMQAPPLLAIRQRHQLVEKLAIAVDCFHKISKTQEQFDQITASSQSHNIYTLNLKPLMDLHSLSAINLIYLNEC